MIFVWIDYEQIVKILMDFLVRHMREHYLIKVAFLMFITYYIIRKM